MEDYEIVELLLGYAQPRKDMRLIAKEMLRRFGGMDGVVGASAEELQTVPGVGPGIATFCHLLREVRARCAESPVRRRETFCTPDEVMAFARLRLGSCPCEEVWIATVDTSNRLISWERVHKGTVNAAPLYPRDVLEVALQRKANGFFLVHNHPGGSTRPSKLDMDTTRKMMHIAQGLDIRFMDHIIVTARACCSLRQEGLMDAF